MFLPLPQKNTQNYSPSLGTTQKSSTLLHFFSQGRTSYLNTCVTHLKFSAVIWSTYIRENLNLCSIF